MDLHEDDVKIVCANKPENINKIGNRYHISDELRRPKLINFYTSTAFEGVDIEDLEGRTIIVSDGNVKQTLLDISTLVIQICGRIRDSLYNNELTHIFSKNYRNRNRSTTWEKYRYYTKEQEVRDLSFLKSLNQMPVEQDRRRALEGLLRANKDNPYFSVDEDGHAALDINVAKHDRMVFKILNDVYGSSDKLFNAYSRSKFKVLPFIKSTVGNNVKSNSISKTPFKKLFLEYVNLRTCKNLSNSQVLRVQSIEAEMAIVREAYDILGVVEIKRLNYKVGRIRSKLLIRLTGSDSDKVKLLLAKKLPLHNDKLKVRDAVAILQEVYSIVGIDKPAKASDFSEWYSVDIKNVRYGAESAKTIFIKSQTYITI